MTIKLPNLKKNIAYLTVSDIHLFHDQNETSYICESFFEYMDGWRSTSRFSKLDIIFIAGDIFETYRDTKHPDNVHVNRWMYQLMLFCKTHGIKLRILYGTPGHDYKQSKNFEGMAAAFGPELDYKYFEVLSIEKMDDLGISILYVPDEWAGSAAVCKEQVIELLDRNGLDQVDIACMHGMFDFQIPDLGVHPLKHDSEWYHGIVRSYINIGHDHTFKTFGRIIVQGSFDRMAHGEEGKKGAVVCHLRTDGEHAFEFIENKRARTFKTIVVKTRDLEQAVEQVRKILDKLPTNSHIRISTARDNSINTVIDEFRRAHPGMKFKKHEDKKQKENAGNAFQETVSLTQTYTAISLNEDNIIQQTLDNLSKQLSPQELDLLMPELQAIL